MFHLEITSQIAPSTGNLEGFIDYLPSFHRLQYNLSNIRLNWLILLVYYTDLKLPP
jgi:hypothetical protein